MTNQIRLSVFALLALVFCAPFASAQEFEQCRDLGGAYERIAGTERIDAPSSDHGTTFTFSRTFKIAQDNCTNLVVDIPLTSKDHHLLLQGDATYYREGRFLYRNFSVRVVPTADADVVRLIYEEWTGILGRFSAVSHYEALYQR